MASRNSSDQSAQNQDSQGTSRDVARSDENLGNGNNEDVKRENNADGGETGNMKGPPQPVGFWDKSLSKTRLQVFGLWARTSQFS